MLFKGIVVTVTVQQRMPLLKTECRNQAIDSLPNGKTLRPKRTVVTRGRYSQSLTSG